MIRFGLPFVYASCLWLLWSGYFDGLMLSFGLISCLFVAWIAARFDLVGDHDKTIPVLMRFLAYLPWLFKEIVLSSVDVSKRIWSPSLPISPGIVRVPVSQETPFALVVHAHSITLTPGTLSLDANFKRIAVHALATEVGQSLCEGEFNKRARALEGSRQ